MFKKIISLIIMGFLCSFCFAQTNVTAEFLLNKVDETRSPEGDSFSSVIEIVTTEDKEIVESNTMRVLTKLMEDNKNRSIAIVLEPEIQEGRTFLLIDTDTWLYIPGAQNTIKISPAQKLSGNVSTGDILSVNYKADYSPAIIGEENIGDTSTFKLELSARTSRVNYFKIILFIDQNSYRPVIAEYYTKSGRLLKKGYFRKFQKFDERTLCTEMIIVDAIFQKKITFIRYTDFTVQEISDSSFNKDLIKDLQL